MWEQNKGAPIGFHSQPSAPPQPPNVMPMQYQQSGPAYPPLPGQPQPMPQAYGSAQPSGPPPAYTPYVPQEQYAQAKSYPQTSANPYPNPYNNSNYPPTQPMQPGMGYPSVSQQHNPQQSGYPSGGYPTYQYNPNPYPQITSGSTVVMPHAFDAGARFDGISQPNVPPPPPGCIPNPAQMAMMNGGKAVVGQKKGSFLSGGSSGGYTFW